MSSEKVGKPSTIKGSQRIQPNSPSPSLDFGKFFRGGFDGLDDVFIPGAPAKISGNSFPNLPAGGGWILAQQGLGGKDHAGGTKAALDGAMLDKILLQGVESMGLTKAPNRRNLSPLSLDSQHETGIHGQTVKQDRTAAAVPLFTAILYFRETQIPQCPQESEIHREFSLDLFSIYFKLKGSLFHRSS